VKRLVCMIILLLSPGLLLAAPAADEVSASGLWKVDGEVMGTPVKMTCTLIETDRKLSGTCAGAADGFTAHKIAGQVKAQKAEFHFQTSFGGNPIMLIVNGTLNEDCSKMEGNLDVEPMAVGGSFEAVREFANETPPDASSAPAANEVHSPAAGERNLMPSSTGTWKIDGEVQGTQARMTCVLVEADRNLSGTCTTSIEDQTPRALIGTAAADGLGWRFNAEYQGQPITVSMRGTLAADGTRMNGTIAVAPLDVDGTFVAVKQ
jgi:hypothetical protein